MKTSKRFTSPFGFKPLETLPDVRLTEPTTHIRIVGPAQPKLYDWATEAPELMDYSEQASDPQQAEKLAPVIGSIGIGSIEVADQRTVLNFLQEGPTSS